MPYQSTVFFIVVKEKAFFKCSVEEDSECELTVAEHSFHLYDAFYSSAEFCELW